MSAPLLPSHKSSSHQRKPSTSTSSSRPLSSGSDARKGRRIPVVVRSAARRLFARPKSQWKLGAVVLVILIWLGVRWSGGDSRGRRKGASSRVRRPELVVKLAEPEFAHEWNEKFGVVQVDDNVRDGRHVLLDVIAKAEAQWQQTLDAQPNTLAEAHSTYKHSFLRRPPPLNYDKLFLLSRPSTPSSRQTLSPIISALPMQMYLSSFGKTLRERQAALEASNFTSPTGGGRRFVLTIEQGVLGAEFPWGMSEEGDDEMKAEAMVGLLQAVEDATEGGVFSDLRITVNLETDVPAHVIPYPLAENKFDNARLLEFEDPNDGNTYPLFTWHQACEDFTPLRRKKYQADLDALAAALLVPAAPTFITSQLAYYPCMDPSLMELSPILGSPPPIRDPQPVPRLSFAKVPLSFEILVPDLFPSEVLATQKSVPFSWKDKEGDKGVVWRGKAPRFPFQPWRTARATEDGEGLKNKKKTPKRDQKTTESSDEPDLEPQDTEGQRQETLVFAGRPTYSDGEISYFSPPNATLSTAYRLLLLHKTAIPHHFPPTLKGKPLAGESPLEDAPFEMERWKADAGGLVDAKLAPGERVVCIKTEEGCADLIRDVQVDDGEDGFAVGRDKYVFVLEGEDPTEYMRAGSLVFHASTLEATWLIQAVPWVHFIPVHPSFHDLPSILAFLRDTPEGDKLAQRIATNGRRFAEDALGDYSRLIGVAGVLVEYGRLWSLKRSEMHWEIGGS